MNAERVIREERTRQEQREERERTKRRFRPDNRRSVRMQAILSSRPKPKRGAK